MASSANFPIGKNKFMREEVELSNNMQENDVCAERSVLPTIQS